MKHSRILIAALAALAALSAPLGPMTARAEDAPPPITDILPNEEELRALGDLAQRMMRDLVGKMEPMVERLQALVDDIDAYQAPEMLPNGDIIIRRRPEAGPVAPKAGDEGISL